MRTTYAHSQRTKAVRYSVVSMRRRGIGDTRSRPCASHIQAQIWPIVKVVRLPGDYRCNFEIFCRWRRSGLPLEASCRPRIGTSNFAEERGPGEINHRQQIAYGENGGASSGHDVVHLKLRRIHVIAARHAEVAKNKLWEEGQVESDEENDCGETRKPFRIQAAGNLGPPEVQAAEIAHDCAANHDVVKVGDHEIGVVNVNVGAQAAEEEAGQAADQEESQEAKGVEHWRVERN